MKKIILAIVLISGIALMSACQKDACPAHGSIKTEKSSDRV